MATTPPPRQSVNTPPTPLHGAKHDTYQPYLPRKSTRNTAKRNLHFEQTPPPPSSNHNLRSSSSSTSPKFRRLDLAKQSSHTFSPPSSAQSSPQTKKGAKSVEISDRVTRSKDSARHSFTTTASSLEVPSQDNSIFSSSKLAVATSVNMLPTPAKTPRKRPAQPAPALKATARVLFPTHPTSAPENISSPKKKVKKGRKYNGFSLDSFTSEDGNEGENGKIAIFTDSKDRVPELDESEDNPFYVRKSNVQATGSRVSRRKKIVQEIKRDPKVEEALNRDDGLVYVFRGKKIFRKFEDDPTESDEAEVDAARTSPPPRPLTRSSLKPRLLFPPAAEAELVDEEAITDIEEQAQAGDSEMTDVAADTEEEHLTTPVNNVFTPFSPPTPTSARVTRGSASKLVAPEPIEYLPTDTKKGKKASPFDGWQRSKAGAGAGPVGKGKKREGDIIERNGGTDGKRVRSGAA